MIQGTSDSLDPVIWFSNNAEIYDPDGGQTGCNHQVHPFFVRYFLCALLKGEKARTGHASHCIEPRDDTTHLICLNDFEITPAGVQSLRWSCVRLVRGSCRSIYASPVASPAEWLTSLLLPWLIDHTRLATTARSVSRPQTAQDTLRPTSVRADHR